MFNLKVVGLLLLSLSMVSCIKAISHLAPASGTIQFTERDEKLYGQLNIHLPELSADFFIKTDYPRCVISDENFNFKTDLLVTPEEFKRAEGWWFYGGLNNGDLNFELWELIDGRYKLVLDVK